MSKIRSQMPFIAWRSVPSQNAAMSLAMQFQLDRSPWQSPPELLVQQMQQVGHVLSHAFKTVPFYRIRLESLGLVSRRELSLDNWQRIPLLTRAELQQHYSAICSKEVPNEHQPIKPIVTSGSMGRPVQVLVTEITSLFWQALTLRDHLWHKRDFAGTQAVIRSVNLPSASPPDGLAMPHWGTAIASVFRTGPSFKLDVHASIEQQVAWLQRIRALPDETFAYDDAGNRTSANGHTYTPAEVNQFDRDGVDEYKRYLSASRR